jgi:hypothetical protein
MFHSVVDMSIEKPISLDAFEVDECMFDVICQ